MKVAVVCSVNGSMSGASTKLLVPSKDRPLPNLPDDVQAVPLRLPVFWFDDASAADCPTALVEAIGRDLALRWAMAKTE